MRRFRVLGFRDVKGFLVAEWIHLTHFGIILFPTIKLKVYTFGGL